jgi:hypothetical protein
LFLRVYTAGLSRDVSTVYKTATTPSTASLEPGHRWMKTQGTKKQMTTLQGKHRSESLCVTPLRCGSSGQSTQWTHRTALPGESSHYPDVHKDDHLIGWGVCTGQLEDRWCITEVMLDLVGPTVGQTECLFILK